MALGEEVIVGFKAAGAEVLLASGAEFLRRRLALVALWLEVCRVLGASRKESFYDGYVALITERILIVRSGSLAEWASELIVIREQLIQASQTNAVTTIEQSWVMHGDIKRCEAALTFKLS